MNVLVTGANGFLGQEIINQLISKNYSVTAMVRKYKRVNNPNQLIEYVEADISDKDKINNIFETKKIDKVIHLAYSMDIFGEDPAEVINTNIQGFINIVEACKNHSIQRLVWCSSVMVYGKAIDYEYSLVNERHSSNPFTLYGKCKEFCEFLTNHYSRKFNQDIICLRPTTIYGPERYVKGAASFLYDCTYAAKTGEEVIVNRLARTDLVHVKDVGQAFLLALDANRPSQNIFNISGQEVSSEELIAIYEKITNKKLKIVFKEENDNLFPTKIDSSSARNILNYNPSINIEEGISNYLATFDPKVPLKR